MNDGMLATMRDLRRVYRSGPEAIQQRQTERLATLVEHARANSPFYGASYDGLPRRVEDVTTLPVTNKSELMANFDGWCTDRSVTLDDVSEFIADLDNVGADYRGEYLVFTTSGTTGRRGVFLQDRQAWNVLQALAGSRIRGTLLNSFGEMLTMGPKLGKLATVVGTGGHFGGAAMRQRQIRQNPGRAKRMRAFSVHDPLEQTVRGLNEYQPGYLNGYASAISLLAREQEAGRLRIKPALILTASEGLPPEEMARIESAFGTRVRSQYGASEFVLAGFSCGHGWLHTNADWLILEPVDENYDPVPTDVTSHTVLMTNLSNRLQPIIRYDLGDRVLRNPDPCACGNPLPAIQVEGRSADLVTFTRGDGGSVTLPPLALGTAIDKVPGVERFQAVVHQGSLVRLRLRIAEGQDAEHVRDAANTALRQMLRGVVSMTWWWNPIPRHPRASRAVASSAPSSSRIDLNGDRTAY